MQPAFKADEYVQRMREHANKMHFLLNPHAVANAQWQAYKDRFNSLQLQPKGLK